MNISPLRYPGGKTVLAPFLQELLLENNLQGGIYAEPYAGGAGAALNFKWCVIAVLAASGRVAILKYQASCMIFQYT